MLLSLLPKESCQKRRGTMGRRRPEESQGHLGLSRWDSPCFFVAVLFVIIQQLVKKTFNR